MRQAFFLCIIAVVAHSAAWAFTPVLDSAYIPRDEYGNFIPITFPPPDSTYAPNELIIKFRKGALRYDSLCYTSSPVTSHAMVDSVMHYYTTLDDSVRQVLLGQRFSVGIITSSTGNTLEADSLRNIILSFGGKALIRMTCANPCEDTISVTRSGDTVATDNYNWMVLELDNDTSVVELLEIIRGFNDIEIADLSMYDEPTRNPNDPMYVAGYQRGIDNQFPWLMNVARAWDFEVGNYAIKVGIVDDGVDYRHCDLMNGRGIGYKVVGGWNFTANNREFHWNSYHGTPCAGIIGALTNNYTCGVMHTLQPEGVAGIAGGWGTYGGATSGGPGVQLFGFRCSTGGRQISRKHAISAILEASSSNPRTGYGYGVHILNNSYASSDFSTSQQYAVAYAYGQGVSFVAGRGNNEDDGTDAFKFPACHDGSWVLSTGASSYDKSLCTPANAGYGSDFGRGMDFVAPGAGSIIYTAGYLEYFNIPNPPMPHRYGTFSGTSAAGPHVAGLVGLLRSTVKEQRDMGRPNWDWYPEDYEWVIKSSAEDQQNNSSRNDSRYLVNYDAVTGWGHVQADNAYTMLDDGYRVSHFSKNTGLNYGAWQPCGHYHFLANGRPGTIPAGIYGPYGGSYNEDMYIREITTTFTLPTGRWDSNAELYVWGTGGNQNQGGGINKNHPNAQMKWSEVISGTGGNGQAAGIKHGHSLTVTARTFQFGIRKTGGFPIQVLTPANTDIALHISVFGKEIVRPPFPKINSETIDKEEQLFASGIDIYPNPVSEKMTISFYLDQLSGLEITLVDQFGRNAVSSILPSCPVGYQTLEIDTHNIPAGVYYCRVTGTGNIGFSAVRQVVIIH